MSRSIINSFGSYLETLQSQNSAPARGAAPASVDTVPGLDEQVLRALRAENVTKVSDLFLQLRGVSLTDLLETLSKLEHVGFIRLVGDDQERRASLTPSGRQVVEHILQTAPPIGR